LRRQRVTDHIADVVGHKIGLLYPEGIHNAGDINGLIFLGVAAIRVRGQPHAAQVRHDDGVIPDQLCRQRRPHVAGIPEAV
jgi:hypothetical protein